MRPAYPISLTQEQLALLGELTAILGQVEEYMIITVARLLRLDRAAANVVMGSTKTDNNFHIWMEVIRCRFSQNSDLLWLTRHARRENQSVSSDRNDFIHAWFDEENDYVEAGYVEPGYIEGRPVARRVRGTETRPVSDLVQIRDRACRLSNIVAHVNYLTSPGKSGPSPWLERIHPPVPPNPEPTT